MASELGKRKAEGTAEEADTTSLSKEARREAEAAIGLVGLAGKELSPEEKSQVYKDTYNKKKAEWEADVESILEKFPELDAKLKAEGVSVEECAQSVKPTKENVEMVAEVLKTLESLPAGGGGRRRRHETPLGRRRSMRGGAWSDVVDFFKVVCSFPFRLIARAAVRFAATTLNPIRQFLGNEDNLNRVAEHVAQLPFLAGAWALGHDLMADNSFITRVVTAILQRFGNQLGVRAMLQGLVNAGVNVGAMAGAAVWPIATLATLLLVRYAVKSAWAKCYSVASAAIRAEYFGRGMAGLPEDVRLMKTFALAIKLLVKSIGSWIIRRVDGILNRGEYAEMDADLQRWHDQNELIEWARRSGIRASPEDIILQQRLEEQRLPAAGLARLREAGPLEGPGGSAEAHDGGRRRTRRHRVPKRKTHKKRFHRK